MKEEIVRRIEEQKDVGKKLFVIEAALLIQDGYKSICDKMCYVYADLDVRISRLCKYRGFTQERAQAVIDSQESEGFIWKPATIRLIIPGRLKIRKRLEAHIR